VNGRKSKDVDGAAETCLEPELEAGEIQKTRPLREFYQKVEITLIVGLPPRLGAKEGSACDPRFFQDGQDLLRDGFQVRVHDTSSIPDSPAAMHDVWKHDVPRSLAGEEVPHSADFVLNHEPRFYRLRKKLGPVRPSYCPDLAHEQITRRRSDGRIPDAVLPHERLGKAALGQVAEDWGVSRPA